MYVLSREQVLDLLEQIKDHRDYAIIYTAVFTGMHQGELLGLHSSDVGFLKAIINVRQQLQYIPGKGYLFKGPKTDKGRRQIPMGNPLVQMSARNKQEQAQEKLLYGINYEDHDLVFCLENGRP